MSKIAVSYVPRPEVTPEKELAALAIVYKFILDAREKKKEGSRPGAPDDAERRSDEIGATAIIQRTT